MTWNSLKFNKKSIYMSEFKSQIMPLEEEARLLDYLIVIAKHKRMICYTVTAVTLLTYLILFVLPNKYTSTALLLPPQQNLTLSAQLLDSLGGSSQLAKETAGGAGGFATMLGLKTPADLYVGMLKSNPIFDRIIDRFDLRKVYGKTYIEDVRKRLGNRAVIGSGKDGIISIEVTDTDPQRAAAIANAFMEELGNLLQKMAISEATDRSTFLAKERTLSLQRLIKAEEGLRTFSEQSDVLQIDAQTKGMLEYVASLRASIDSKEVQLQVLRRRATPINPELVQLETEIKGLKGKLKDCDSKDSQLCGTSMIGTSRVPSLGLEYMRLFRETKFQEGLYQLYCKLVELSRLDEVRNTSVVQVVGYAKQPEKRSNIRAVPALLAGIATLVIMIIMAFVLEYYRGIRTNEEITRRWAILRNYMKIRRS
jgi:tyrosine-protein kinase Etk/Wzc